MVPRILLITITLLMLVTASPGGGGGGGGDDHRVRADLGGGGLASGRADYRERIRNNTLEQRFSIEVEDAKPGAMMQVRVNDVLFGTLVVNDFGFGELQYRTPAFIDEPGDGAPIPDGFPTLLAGEGITVGPLSGTFEDH